MAFRNKAGEKSARVERLRPVSFFEGFTDKELERVAELVEDCEADEGAELTEQGKPGQVCYVIVEGTAGVFVGRERVATLGSGSTVGEMALIDHAPRSATVRAETPMQLLALDAKRFQTLMEELPKASQKIMAQLGERLRNRNLS